MTLLRQIAATSIAQAGWDIPAPSVVWSPRMTRCTGQFVVEKDSRGAWLPEIRLSIPLIRRLDRPWPVEVYGCLCSDAQGMLQRTLEHELVHYKLWCDGEKDWDCHPPRFRHIAWETFGHYGESVSKLVLLLMALVPQIVATSIAQAGWDIPAPHVEWSYRMTSKAGQFEVEQDGTGAWQRQPKIRLSIPLFDSLDSPDRTWPVEVCGCHCHDPEGILQRTLEHELVHYKLWCDGDKCDHKQWGHTSRFRQIAWESFGHQGIYHGIGVEE